MAALAASNQSQFDLNVFITNFADGMVPASRPFMHVPMGLGASPYAWVPPYSQTQVMPMGLHYMPPPQAPFPTVPEPRAPGHQGHKGSGARAFGSMAEFWSAVESKDAVPDQDRLAYAELFQRAGVTSGSLMCLDDAELCSIGITNRLHRRSLMLVASAHQAGST